MGLFVKLMDLPKGVVAAKFKGTIHIYDAELTTLKRRCVTPTPT